jgi:ribosomal protein L11 methyltransferase
VIAAREVDDEDWARRSQEGLQPVTVGRVTVYPHDRSVPRTPASSPLAIVIQPSMGFGTGHHATTRLCLLALQREDLAGRTVLDIGTGSGILAIAAVGLGAARAMGVDNDPDAIQAARENLALNSRRADLSGPPIDAADVTFEVAELVGVRLTASAKATAVRRSAGRARRRKPDPTGGSTPDVVIANLTGALLAREAHRILGAVRRGGRIIVSGLLAGERDQVVAAFEPAALVGEDREDEWVLLTFIAPNDLP